MVNVVSYFFKNENNLNDYYKKQISSFDYEKYKTVNKEIVDIDDAVDEWKIFVQPDYMTTNENLDLFLFFAISFYLFDNDIKIKQHPELLKRIKPYLEISNNDLKNATAKIYGRNHNGNVTWESRRLYIDDLKFVKKTESIIMNTSMKINPNTVFTGAFDTYKVLNHIDNGGNGFVWEAIDSDNEHLAIKFIRKEKHTEKIKRFKNEAAFAFKSHHKNIIKVSDFGQDDNWFFSVMPLYDFTLRDKINNGIKPDDAIEIFIGIISGLQYAHEQNIIHRDIKPENILFKNNSNNPIIADFGIAHFSEEDLATAIKTKATERMANFNYAAPEQKPGSKYKITFSTDLYSAALILNQMFTGEIPQAPDYKKISEVNFEFSFLDSLFEDLYRQNPNDRLYPEEKILLKLNMLMERYKVNKEIDKIDDKINQCIVYDEYKPVLSNCYFKDEKLFFLFDREIERMWFDILTSTTIDCVHMLNYPPSSIKMHWVDNSILYIDMIGASKDMISNNVEYAKKWFDVTTDLYNKEMINFKKQEIANFEKEKQKNQNKLEREESINNMLNDIEFR